MKNFCECCGQVLAAIFPDKLPAFELLKPMPGLPAGVIFVWDRSDAVKGSIADGCMKLAWNNGNCQASFCAETHILHAQTRELKDWFRPVANNGRYTVNSARAAHNEVR